jgi:hypothetical protein
MNLELDLALDLDIDFDLDLDIALDPDLDLDLDLQEIAKKELESLQEQSSSTREEMGDLEAKAANLQEPLE